MEKIEFNKVYNCDCIDGMRETAAKKKVAHNAQSRTKANHTTKTRKRK